LGDEAAAKAVQTSIGYRDRDATFDPDAPIFRVHPGLKEKLALREERR
jgi:hypothetical protein